MRMVLEDLLVGLLTDITPGYERLVIGACILPSAAATIFVAIGLNNSEWRSLWQPIHKVMHKGLERSSARYGPNWSTANADRASF